MEYAIEATERHSVDNTAGKGKAEIEQLKQYIQRINRMEGMEFISLSQVKLTVDDETISVKHERIVAVDDRDDLLEKGYKKFDGAIWGDTSDLMHLLGRAEKGTNISFEIAYYASVWHTGGYGIAYWSEADFGAYEVPTITSDHSEHRIIEYYVEFEGVAMFKRSRDGSYHSAVAMDGKKAFDAEPGDVADIEEWFGPHFKIDIYADGNWDDIPEHRDTIMKMAKNLEAKYSFLNKVDEPFEEQLLIFDCLTLPSDRVKEFIEDIQEIITYAYELNANIDINGAFISSKGYPFAAMVIDLDDKTQVITKHFRF